ncbi:hypothetical protein BDW68DRAFT_30993 [Aspergillus falconensis]
MGRVCRSCMCCSCYLPVVFYSCIGYRSHSVCSSGNWPDLAHTRNDPNLKLITLCSGK